MLIARTDTSIIGRWWWTVDRLLLATILGLSIFGGFLVAAASPAVAERIGLPPMHFINRHFIYLIGALGLMIVVSMLSDKNIRRVAILGLLATIFMMGLTLVTGYEIKGATRWLPILGFQIQPSEFMKPCFAIFSAWLLARQSQGLAKKNYLILAVTFSLIIALLIAQPDFGMSMLTAIIIAAQIFVAGFPLYLIAIGVAGLALFGFWAYLNLPHVTSRIDRWLDPASGDTYQVEKSMQSFAEGGLFGVGPGEGTVKMLLPDAHADFIFAVSGEEMGFLLTLILMLLFVFIISRSIYKSLKRSDLFVLLAVTGIMTQFAVQAMIHMGSSLHMIPTKGMTLPLVSYGGSSLLAIGLSLGFVLGLTRKKPSLSGLTHTKIFPDYKGTKMPYQGKIS